MIVSIINNDSSEKWLSETERACQNDQAVKLLMTYSKTPLSTKLS